MTPKIEGRPEFGNPEHIKAIKDAAAQVDFKALPMCQKCDGQRECPKCDQECEACDGTGKDYDAYGNWKEKYPHTWPDFK